MADRSLLLPQVGRPGQRLGRHINHDSRSIAYRVGREAAPKTVLWERKIPILDQGDLGSCTGNATVGVLGTEPYFTSLSATQRATLNEDLAVAIYSGGTKRDSFPGTYPPEDTGSDGLSVAKEAKARALISGYQHILSIGEAHAAIQAGPFIVGTVWMNDMFNPVNGIVTPGGAAAGGHEYVCRGYDLNADLWTFDNSWTSSWGIDGSFKMSTKSLTWLLSQQGDATPFVPLTVPAPQPAPPPQPGPTPTPAPVPPPLVGFPYTELDQWAAGQRPYWTRKAKDAANAYITWRGKFNG
jgi:hypothetical protein